MLRRLPDDALSRTTPEIRLQMAQAQAWDSQTELIAQLLEVTRIMAADMRTKGEPQKVERPEFLTRPPVRPGDRDAAFKQAISLLKATSRP